MKIILRIVGYNDIVFESYEDLNVLWSILENYENCQLIISRDEKAEEPVKTEVPRESEEIVETEVKRTEEGLTNPCDIVGTEIAEDIGSTDEKNAEAVLKYSVPKSVTFTQRFQDRVSKEITDILNNVYPNMFIIDNISYKDKPDDGDNMEMFITIKATSDDGMNSLVYLDRNVEYIMKDLIDYYI